MYMYWLRRWDCRLSELNRKNFLLTCWHGDAEIAGLDTNGQSGKGGHNDGPVWQGHVDIGGIDISGCPLCRTPITMVMRVFV